ncbi:MAG TPA: TIGR00266 family protein [Anaerolineae bacterium]|nr:TIGR00266 family protein [Anaerolineae bacterium]
MQVEITYRPSYALAVVSLDANQSIQAEAGAMVSMSPDVAIETKAAGGIMGALRRSVLGGESFFMNTYRAGARGGQITLAPVLPGDMTALELADEALMVQSGSYVASSEGIDIDTKWSGAETFFAREGLIMLKCSGSGTLVLSSYGAIHEMELSTGEAHVIDTGHIVAFAEGMGFKVKRIGGMKSTLFSGEGLVVDLTGPGKVLLQTRSDDAFLSWLIPRLPKESSR